jgi:hypothetical protein
MGLDKEIHSLLRSIYLGGTGTIGMAVAGTGTRGSGALGSLGFSSVAVAGLVPVESVEAFGATLGWSAGGSAFLGLSGVGGALAFASGGFASSGSGRKAVSG